MSRHRMPEAVALFVALTVLAATPASAQFGGLAKKAKQAAQAAAEKKVDKKTGNTANSNLRPSNTFGEELTESSFSNLLRGLNAELAKTERRDALHADADSAHQRNERLQRLHHADFQAYERQTAANRDCRRTAEETNQAKNEQAMQTKVKQQLSPAFQKDMAEMSARNEKARAKAEKSGDKAAIDKANENYQRDLMTLLGFDPRADSLAVERQCPTPREPASVTESKALTERENSIRVQIRALDGEITTAGAAASGMTPEVYALAKERVLNWSQEAFDNGSQVQEFGDAERKVFEAHKREIKTFRKVLA
jgi:hypothetical protein